MPSTHIDLLAAVEILDEHLTRSLCEVVFEERRVAERRRVWTLDVMLEFWTAVILRAPSSLRQALDEASRGTGGFPHVQSTPQAFFARAQSLSWEFFADVLECFTYAAAQDSPPAFEKPLQKQLTAFSGVWVVDGSCLDRIAHRLKILHEERSVVLPGCILGLYDLFHGIPRRVLFCEDARRAEVPRLREVLDDVPAGTLLLGDRAYCSHVLFGEISEREISALVRCTKSISLVPLEDLGRRRHQGGSLHETIVLAGTPQRRKQQQRLRLIEWKKGKRVLRLLTNVLDPERLTANAAIDLYRRRWSIERMFYDLKEVLNLRRFHTANVNAVSMQVHAAALVYVALRIAQARIAEQAHLPPERLSVDKLFPRVAAAHFSLVCARRGFLATQAANPRVRLREPDWHQEPFARTPLAGVLVEPRNPQRRKWRPPNGPHASLHHFKRGRRGPQS